MGKSESGVYFKATKGSHGDDCLRLRVAESSWMIKNKSGTYCAAVRTHSCCCSRRERRMGVTNIVWEISRRQERLGDAVYIKFKSILMKKPSLLQVRMMFPLLACGHV